MGDALKLLILAAVLVGVLFFLLRTIRPKGGPGSAGAKDVDDLARYQFEPATSGFITGFVTCMALLAFIRNMAPGIIESGIAIAVAVCFAAFSSRGFRTLRGVVAAAAGLVGSFAAFADINAAGRCLPGGAAGAYWMAGILVGVAIASTIFAATFHSTPKNRWSVFGTGWHRWLLLPAGIFAGLEVILFFSSPLGVPLTMTSGPFFGVSLGYAGAVLFGVFIGAFPGLALLLGAVAIGITQFTVEMLWGTACAPPAGVGAVVPLVAFIVAYIVVDFLTRPFRRTPME